ncbi:hypothetical protein Tco_0080429 [Tanacetum coccineum]
MAAVEVPQTLEYRGGQLNVVHVLEVENFTNWQKGVSKHHHSHPKILFTKSYHHIPSSLSSNHHPIRIRGIANMDLVFCEVGLKGKVMGLSMGAVDEVKVTHE